jgi:hypothetical protein
VAVVRAAGTGAVPGCDTWGNQYYAYACGTGTQATSAVTWITTTTANTTAASFIAGGTITSTQLLTGRITAWPSWNACEETAEAREQREAREREAARRQRERRAVRLVANDRATELLLELLTAEQARSYTERGYFEVRGSRGGRWRIRNRGQQGNVELMAETGELAGARFCCHPPASGGLLLPDADAHIAQMLAIATDEAEFVRTANRLRLRAA